MYPSRRHRHGPLALLVLLVVCPMLGCGEQQHSITPVAVETAETTSEPEITVSVIDREKYDQLIASKQGKVVLVDFWATWCAPCVQQFPHTVELAEKFGDDVAVVSVSMDQPQDQEKVQAFLKAKSATFDNLLSEYGIGSRGFEAFEITDGAVPHYKIYDQTGKLRHTANSNEEIESQIASLLKESS